MAGGIESNFDNSSGKWVKVWWPKDKSSFCEGVVSSQEHSGKNLGKETSTPSHGSLHNKLPEAVSSTKDCGEELIGRKIKVWRPKSKTYSEGTVASYDISTKKHFVVYTDGAEEILNLRKQSTPLKDFSHDQDLKTSARAHASSNVLSRGDDMEARGHVIKKHKGHSFDLPTPRGSFEMSMEEKTQKPEVGISPISSKLSVIPGEDDLVNINGYKVKATTAPVLEAIFAKYGDITANCFYKSLSVKASLLEVICNIIQRLHSDIEAILSNLEVIENEVSDVEASKIEVAWLHEHLEKLRKVASCRDKSLQLREDKVTSGIVTKSATKELTQRRAELMEALERFREAEKRETVMKLVSRKIEDDVTCFEAEESFLKRRLNELL